MKKVKGELLESFLIISSITVETQSRNHLLPSPESEREAKENTLKSPFYTFTARDKIFYSGV